MENNIFDESSNKDIELDLEESLDLNSKLDKEGCKQELDQGGTLDAGLVDDAVFAKNALKDNIEELDDGQFSIDNLPV